MSLRTRIRDWLNAPSAQEIAARKAQWERPDGGYAKFFEKLDAVFDVTRRDLTVEDREGGR